LLEERDATAACHISNKVLAGFLSPGKIVCGLDTGGARTNRGQAALPAKGRDMDYARTANNQVSSMTTTQSPVRCTDRRRVARLLCAVAPASPAARFGQALQAATIQNISSDGIAALVDRETKPDALLTIELFNKTRDCWHLKVMRVVYANQCGNERWKIGCTFLSPMSDVVVQELLASA
jgi:hypothetical protein